MKNAETAVPPIPIRTRSKSDPFGTYNVYLVEGQEYRVRKDRRQPATATVFPNKHKGQKV